MKRLPRGIRNHNPGNIEFGYQWLGLADKQLDERFATFKRPEFGLRAIGRILRAYQRRYNLHTIRGMITRWAPPHENPTNRYVDYIARKLGVGPDEKIDVCAPGVMRKFIEGIVQFENGMMPYMDAVLIRGAALACN